VMREGHLIHEAPAGDLDEAAVLDLVMAGSLLAGAEEEAA
jgi:ribose transport system ATP-binding protein